MGCGHREQKPVNEPVQEKKTWKLFTRTSMGTTEVSYIFKLFFFPIIDTSKKKHTQCTVIITKEYVLIICMLVAELEFILKYSRALEAGSKKHLSMVAIFIFCMVHTPKCSQPQCI